MAAVLGLACMAPGLEAVAQGAAPTAVAAAEPRQQVPGFYRMRLGDVTLTTIYDGAIEMESSVFNGANKADIQAAIQRSYQHPVLQTAVNAFLIEAGPQKILVDVGAAQTIGPGLGKITENLKAAGIVPEQITAVLLTHLHLDHVAGLLTADGRAAFPNAEVYADARDASHWLSKAEQAKANAHARGLFDIAQNSLAPYIANKRFHAFTEGKLPIPGVNAHALIGHSPGHTGYKIESGGEALYFLGDVIHNHVLQLENPLITMEFDWNTKMARNTRVETFKLLAQNGAWVASAHTPFPGVGRIRKVSNSSYAWVPLEYAQSMLEGAKRQPKK